MMNSVGDERSGLRRLFRALSILYFVIPLSVLGIAMTDRSHRDEFRVFVLQFDEPLLVLLLVSVTSVAVLLGLAIQIGLWRFRRWARLLFSLVTVATLVLPLLLGEPDLQRPWHDLEGNIASMNVGALLVLMWAVLRDDFGARGASRELVTGPAVTGRERPPA